MKSLRGLKTTLDQQGPDATGEATGVSGGFAAVARDQARRLHAYFGRLGTVFGSLDRVPGWIEHQVTAPERRSFWFNVITHGLLLPLIVLLIVRVPVNVGLDRAIAWLRQKTAEKPADRILIGTARVMLEAVRPVSVLVAGYLLLAATGPAPAALAIAEIVIMVITFVTAIGVIGRLVLLPSDPSWRGFPVAPATGAYLRLWLRRLAVIWIIGFAGVMAGRILGSDPDLNHVVLVTFAVLFSGVLIVLIMQSRKPLAAFIRGAGDGVFRRRLAEFWHILAVVYVVLVLVVVAANFDDGFRYLMRGTAVTVVAVALGFLASIVAERLLARLFRIDEEIDRRFPGLRTRSNLYRPVFKRVLDGIIAVIVLVVVLEGWHLGIVDILSAELRVAVISSAVTILAILVLGVVVWEVSSSAIARVLQGRDGAEPGMRVRTLLPLLRRAILLGVFIIGGLMILSEIGIDTAPLLAGAGVIGLALGFGSQALVRDIITGLFILVEDTISVGDVVTVGGHTGVVEDLSIRTIRLRDVAGTVHTVPFGDVTSVENLTKDYSYALLDIGVGYREDPDEVIVALRETFEALKNDEKFSDSILEDIQILGVNELADSAVVLRSRIKVKPLTQWRIRREFLRRIKKRFDELDIEIPYPHTTLYFGVGKDGSAPAGRLVVDRPGEQT